MSKSDKDNLKRWELSCTGYRTTTPGGPHVAYSPGNVVITTTDKARFSDNLPNWRHLIAIGENATTNMTGDRHQVRPKEGELRYLFPDGTVSVCSGVIDQSCASLVTVGSTIGPVADSRARSKLLQKYIAIKSTWRGGNFLAEIRETIHMLRHPVKSFYDQTYRFAGRIGKLKRLAVRNPTDYSKALADLWLAYVFGVKPTVNDANDLAETLNSLVNRQLFDTRGFSAHGHNSAVTTSVILHSPMLPAFPAYPVIKQVITDKSDAHVWYRGAVKCYPQNANRFLIQSFGVDVFDVVPAVYEAIPWSFLVDYFLNLSEMLDSMRYWDADFAWLNRTYRNARTVNASPLLIPTSYGTIQLYGSGGGGYRLAVYVNRAPQPSVPYPNWTFRMPGFPSLKWLNITALARQITYSAPDKKQLVHLGGRYRFL